MEYFCRVFQRRDEEEGGKKEEKYKIFRLSFFIVMRISQRTEVFKTWAGSRRPQITHNVY
jgi:hypothetical protein